MRLDRDWAPILVGIAFFSKLVGAWTHVSWAHPDEWFHTVELGNFLAFGFQSFSEAVSLHLRNLTWPTMVAGGLRFSDFLDPGNVGLRFYLVKLTVALLDLCVVWAVLEWSKRLGFSVFWKNLALILVVLPFFTVADAVRPSQEHLATIALWLSLGFLARENWKRAGFAAALCFAFKYPAGLLTLGLGLGVFWQRGFSKPLAQMSIGLVLGLVFGGLSDLWVYGRFYESFWMYAQYNLLTDLGLSRYGAHSAWEYFSFFRGHWGTYLAPVGCAILLALPFGLKETWKSRSAAFFPFVFYWAGHLWVSHKEPRFMFPIEWLGVWIALLGARSLWEEYGERIPSRALQALAWVGALVFILNGVLFLRALWGESWRKSSTYFEMQTHLEGLETRGTSACAVVSTIRPMGVTLPWGARSRVPEPAFGFLSLHDRDAIAYSDPRVSRSKLAWIDHAPACRSGERVLVHWGKAEASWESKGGCELLTSGSLNWVPSPAREFWIERGLASGVWYSCPSVILSRLGVFEVRRVIAREIPRFEALPPLGVSAEELVRFSEQYRPSGIQEGMMVDL